MRWVGGARRCTSVFNAISRIDAEMEGWKTGCRKYTHKHTRLLPSGAGCCYWHSKPRTNFTNHKCNKEHVFAILSLSIRLLLLLLLLLSLSLSFRQRISFASISFDAPAEWLLLLIAAWVPRWRHTHDAHILSLPCGLWLHPFFFVLHPRRPGLKGGNHLLVYYSISFPLNGRNGYFFDTLWTWLHDRCG